MIVFPRSIRQFLTLDLSVEDSSRVLVPADILNFMKSKLTLRCLYLPLWNQRLSCPVRASLFVTTYYSSRLKFERWRLTWRAGRSGTDEIIGGGQYWKFNSPTYMINRDGYLYMHRVLIALGGFARCPCWGLHWRLWASWVPAMDSIQAAQDTLVWWLLWWPSDVAYSMA